MRAWGSSVATHRRLPPGPWLVSDLGISREIANDISVSFKRYRLDPEFMGNQIRLPNVILGAILGGGVATYANRRTPLRR